MIVAFATNHNPGRSLFRIGWAFRGNLPGSAESASSGPLPHPIKRCPAQGSGTEQALNHGGKLIVLQLVCRFLVITRRDFAMKS